MTQNNNVMKFITIARYLMQFQSSFKGSATENSISCKGGFTVILFIEL